MLEIGWGEGGAVVLRGRFDASYEDTVSAFLGQVAGRVDVDMRALEYISSAGLGALLGAQKRLAATGGGLRLVGVNAHIRELLRFSGFDRIFEVDAAAG